MRALLIRCARSSLTLTHQRRDRVVCQLRAERQASVRVQLECALGKTVAFLRAADRVAESPAGSKCGFQEGLEEGLESRTPRPGTYDLVEERVAWTAATLAAAQARFESSLHGLCRDSGRAALSQSDRLQALIAGLGDPHVQQPSLVVLVGNTEKATAMRTLFRVRGSRKCKIRHLGEVHVHLDPSTALLERPLLVASCDTHERCQSWSDARGETCHGAQRHWLWRPFARGNAADGAYARILGPFADVFCFFAADVGGLRPVAKRLAGLLVQSACHPNRTRPGVVVATETLPCSAEAEAEAEALAEFLRMLKEETAIDPHQHFSSLEIVAVLPRGVVSPDARYLRLKERVMARSDQVRTLRRATRTLFSASHLAALLQGAGEHFANTLNAPCDPVKMSRTHRPVAADLGLHLANFLGYITSSTQLTEFAAPMVASTLLLDSYPPGAHVFECQAVFDKLYRPAFHRASNARVIALQDSADVIPHRGLLGGGATAVEIHQDNLVAFGRRWKHIQSKSTCFCCLRQRPRPQPPCGLPCGHCFCDSCVAMFGDGHGGNPAVVAVGRCISSSRPLGESIEKILELIARRMPLNLALVSRACQLAITHGTAGFRLAGSMESVLHEILGADKRILARSSTTQTNEDSAHADSAALYLFPKPLEATEATHPEPGPGSCKLSADGRCSVYGMIGRTVGLLLEKPTQKPQELQEKLVERIYKTAILTGKLLYRYHLALTQRMDTAVRHLLASLFYLELDPLPQHEAELLQQHYVVVDLQYLANLCLKLVPVVLVPSMWIEGVVNEVALRAIQIRMRYDACKTRAENREEHEATSANRSASRARILKQRAIGKLLKKS
ncbi:patatin-like phospholipase-like protein [Stemphylium lycopersici]|nr:patatin-like phospholipase-like protein [Stemphylium lycopersici]